MIPKHVQASDFADPVDCIGPVDCATCVFVALADELPQKDRPGITVLPAYNGEYQNPPFEKINRLIESGPFDVEVAKTFALEQAAEAQQALDQHYLGKLAIKLN